eukprot:TRINITY_DN2231_c1_g2_i1.p1 TRINITY_DN2231_c1_g2~~TRINITY_DN2231_c1_g2_i1.p1  ORF type:complete len:330 (-),score=152.00 TRINITY_DN2231_c1_g2_i1:69-1058(-)
MKKIVIIFAIFILFLVPLCFASEQQEQQVQQGSDTENEERAPIAPEMQKYSKPYVLTYQDFHKQTLFGVWLVAFVSPGCPACKSLKPVWDELAEEVAHLNKKEYRVGIFDCTKDGGTLCETYSIYSYPSFMYFDNSAYLPCTVFSEARKNKEANVNWLSFHNWMENRIKNHPPYNFNWEKAEKALAKIEAAKPDITTHTLEQKKVEQPEDPFDNPVTVLSLNNFESTIQSTFDFWVVKFFAPWCGHCKRMVADYNDLARTQQKEKHFGVAEVDCTIEKELCEKLSVYGFPTIKLYYKGKFVKDHKGPRTITALTELVNDERAKKYNDEL